MDIQQSTNGLRELALFAGAGGGILGGKLLGWRTVCAVERDAYAAQVLAQRQNDGILAPFPIWSDVCSFDGKPWNGIVDVISGGFPCQDISAAGKGAGITGQRSGLWKEFARIIGEVGPRFVFVENSPMLTIRGLGVVLGDLAEMGFDAEWGVLSAADVGAPHRRDRIWILAYSMCRRHSRSSRTGHGAYNEEWTPEIRWCGWSEIDDALEPSGKNVSNSLRTRSSISRQKQNGEDWREAGRVPASSDWWASEPNLDRMADGVAFRVDRLKGIGNGQVPLCAATAWRLLSERAGINI